MANECLTLIVTAQCNLRCSYCYQNAKSARSAEWEIIQAGIDLVLGRGLPHVELIFLGGEPLLEFELLRQAVSYAEMRDPSGRCFTFGLSTNGTLITDAVADYLDKHEINVWLSFDGVQQAQAHRGGGSFEILNDVLDSLRVEHPYLFRNRLRISMTATPATISLLPESAKYLLEKSVREIHINPCLTPFPGWQTNRIDELDEAFACLAEISRYHAERTGTIPVTILRKAADEVLGKDRGVAACDALTGNAFTLDVDGQLYACPLFAESYQKFPPGSLMEQVSILRLGDVRDPEARRRRMALADSARTRNLWTSRDHSCSSYGRCDECEYYGRCNVCPVSVWQASKVSGPYLVPDFICAFNRVALKYRDRFPSIPDALKGFFPEPDDSDPVKQLEERLRASKSRKVEA